MYSKPKNQRLPREVYSDPEGITFFTIRATESSSPFATVHHSPSASRPKVEFHDALCQKVLECLHEQKEKLGCDVLIACLMPDHIHMLARPRTHAANVLDLMDRFKGKSTNESWSLGHSGRLWQPRSFDEVLRRDPSIFDTAEYIAHNPVRKGYILNWSQWPYTVRWDAHIL